MNDIIVVFTDFYQMCEPKMVKPYNQMVSISDFFHKHLKILQTLECESPKKGKDTTATVIYMTLALYTKSSDTVQ